MLSYFETGSPFLGFKDTANRVNPNDHLGLIRSSNLCTEIFQNTEPNGYKIKVEFEDGQVRYFDENESAALSSGVTKKANKLSSIDAIDGKKIFVVEKERQAGLTAVCNLASVNLSRINTKEDIERVVPIAVRMLDNVIDLNFYPLKKVKETNLRSRAIGLGIMGEAQMLAQKKIHWGSKEHILLIDEIMEQLSYNAINASSDLALEKGKYPNFEGSKWSRGIVPIDSANKHAKELGGRGGLFDYTYNWDDLRAKLRHQGIRNGYLMAIAPTSSISILTGTTQTIEPVYKRKWFEENLSGMIPVVAPNLNVDNWAYYKPAYDIDQEDLVRVAAVRQKWIDQGQSLNIFFTVDKASGRVLHNLYLLAWKLGLKSTYYLRSESMEVKQDVIDRSVECEGCQ